MTAVLRMTASFRLLMLSVLMLSCLHAGAVEPVVSNMNVRGLEIGGTTTLELDGSDFGTNPSLLFPFSVQQTRKAVTDKKATFEVTLGKDVTPGLHHLRLVSEKGVSLPLLIGAERMTQLPVGPKVDKLPVVLHGTVAGSSIMETRLPGKAGQKTTFEVEAQRVGGKLRPVLHVYNSKRLQLGWSWPMPALLGDTRLEVTFPEDGEYVVAVHDIEYASGGGPFRLKMGEWSYVDQVFPPVVGKGQPHRLELLGGGSSTLDFPAKTELGVHPLDLPGETWGGMRPFVRVSANQEIIAVGDGKVQELPQIPVGVCAKLTTVNGEDRYRLPVTPNTKVRLEVFAERLRSPLDASLVVRNDKGDQLVRVDDGTNTTDPTLEYTVPDKVTSIVVGVIDAQAKASPRSIYRLSIEPVVKIPMNFLATTPVQRLNLPAGGRIVMPVWIDRAGYDGPVEIKALGLPAGVTVEGNVVPAGSDGALVTLTSAQGFASAVIIQWTAKGAEEKAVHVKGHPLERLQPWMAREIALAPSSANSADFAIDWSKPADDIKLFYGNKIALPVKVTRTAKDAVVRLSLLTGQNPPLAGNQPDPNKTLRAEKPVEIPANITDGELSILVPAQWSSTSCDVTVQAELLSADKQKVLAVAVAPVRRLEVLSPLAVKLDGELKIDVPLDKKTGTTVKLQGQIERRTNLGEVSVALTGLPAGAKADPVTIKADAAAFTLNVVFPATVPSGEITGVKLSASAVADPKQPTIRVSSTETVLTFVVK